MKRGKVSPLLLVGVVVLVVVAVALYMRFGPCSPCGQPPAGPAAPGAAGGTVEAGSVAAATGNVPSVTPEAASVTPVSTSAIATVAAAQAVAMEQREDELARQMSEAYRKLGELRRAAQESAEVRELHAAIEADRRALDDLTLADPEIRAMTDRRKALLDEMAALQARQSELARQARADATNPTLKAEGQAAIAKIRETSSELGAVSRKLEAARREAIGQNAQAAEIAARLSASQDKARAAVTASPEIQALQQQIQRLAAESRQLSRIRARRTSPAAAPQPRSVVPRAPASPSPAPAGSESGEPSVERNAP